MKIKLINYPYGGFEVGEIVDLGEEKNRSMVSLQRAVFVGIAEKPIKNEAPEIPEEKKEELDAVHLEGESPKKFLQNTLKAQVEQKKATRPASGGKTAKKSFWDNLK